MKFSVEISETACAKFDEATDLPFTWNAVLMSGEGLETSEASSWAIPKR